MSKNALQALMANKFEKPKVSKAKWTKALLPYIETPSQHENMVYDKSEWVVIRDIYPKAKHHYLVIPKQRIESIWDLDKSHISLLQQFHTEAESLTELMDQAFQFGFHAIPSMR